MTTRKEDQFFAQPGRTIAHRVFILEQGQYVTMGITEFVNLNADFWANPGPEGRIVALSGVINGTVGIASTTVTMAINGTNIASGTMTWDPADPAGTPQFTIPVPGPTNVLPAQGIVRSTVTTGTGSPGVFATIAMLIQF